MSWLRRVLRPVLAGALAVAAGIPAAAPVAIAGSLAAEWEHVLPGLELTFPRDHGAHLAYRTEWWYVTGQATDRDGRRFGFQFTVFRSGMGAAPPPPGVHPLRAHHVYAGHLAVTDVAARATRFADRLRRAGSPFTSASEDDLDLVLEDWSLRRGEGDRLLLRAADPATGIGLDLALVPEKPLVLQGEEGYSRKGEDEGNASAYASWTRLGAEGRLTSGGETHAVEGAAWFDHEFGSSVLEEGVVGWDWFGLHLADGRDLMLFGLRREEGGRSPFSSATLVEAGGGARTFSGDELAIEVLGTWESERTGARYPAGWRLSLPEVGLALDVEPLVADCEVGGGGLGVVYWEGPVEVRGTVRGSGYAELTGYAGSMEGRF